MLYILIVAFDGVNDINLKYLHRRLQLVVHLLSILWRGVPLEFLRIAQLVSSIDPFEDHYCYFENTLLLLEQLPISILLRSIFCFGPCGRTSFTTLEWSSSLVPLRIVFNSSPYGNDNQLVDPLKDSLHPFGVVFISSLFENCLQFQTLWEQSPIC